jgi:large subunit ribosomal protein L10
MPNQANVQQTEQIREIFDNADVVLLTDFQGLTVAEINELRDQLRAAGIRYRVCKNTLINVVAQERGIDGLAPYLKGNTALATGTDPATSSKILLEFGEEHENFKVKGGILGTRIVDAAGVEVLKDMPSRDVMIARTVGIISAPLAGLVNTLNQGSSVTGMVNVLSGTIRQVTSVLTQVADQKKEAENA